MRSTPTVGGLLAAPIAPTFLVGTIVIVAAINDLRGSKGDVPPAE
jgi:hypothetical protein